MKKVTDKLSDQVFFDGYHHWDKFSKLIENWMLDIIIEKEDMT